MWPHPLHLVGYATGATLYAMLLVMARRDRSSDGLTVGAGALGLTWNVGEILRGGATGVGWSPVGSWLAAVTFTSLGLLAAVVIHSVIRGAPSEARPHRRGADRLRHVAYAASAAAAGMHVLAAARGRPVPDPTGLHLLTFTLLALAPWLLATTRHQANGRRAMWMTGLAIFAISSLHITGLHGPSESWPAGLVGHHASVPLAFAILYQDYRFVLADLFLKQALTVVLIVGLALGAFHWLLPQSISALSPGTLSVLVAAWLLSLWLVSAVRRGVSTFVDRVVLSRDDPQDAIQRISSVLADLTTERELLDETCRALRPALNANAVTWEVRFSTGPAEPDSVVVDTTERPFYRLRVGTLAGGRRLLSGDFAVLDRVSSVLGRRLDLLRLTQERYARKLREQQMESLATEAELRALRAQVNPHFLFNALTTISYLIHQVPGRAVTTLGRLTTLLRGVLYTDGEFTTLRRELDLIRCYLDIERERFEERLDVAITVPDAVAHLTIPALIVQPLVENAIKHGIAKSRAGGRVCIDATVNDRDRLCIAVRNTGAPLSPARDRVLHGGLGLANVERRLAAYYGGDAMLTLSTTPTGETQATILLPVALPTRRTATVVGL